MNWNFNTADYQLRLPNSEQDVEALMGLLKQPQVSAHIPALPLLETHRVVDELRRMAMRFEAREAAFWLVEKDQALLGRIGIVRINWLQRSAQMQWELGPELDSSELKQVVPAILDFVFSELNLHRIEMRLLPNTEQDDLLRAAGFEFEGNLPAQLEYLGRSIDLSVWSLLS